MTLVTLYKDRIGYTISLVLTEDDGTPIDLTNATVTIKLYSTGTDTLKWSNTATVDDASNGLAHYDSVAGDFDTTGAFYSLIDMVYSGGDQRTQAGDHYEIIENEENNVSVDEFLQFIDVAEENAKQDNTIKSYLETAETLVDLEVPAVASTTDVDILKQKKVLIKIKAAILYFMNTDENFVDPNKRAPKIEVWQKQYTHAMQNLNEVLSDTSTGSAVVRRVKNSGYSDPNSYLYEG
jgi:hypothetical protein